MRRFYRGGQRGSAFVELAVALPVLLVVFAAAADFARVFYTGIQLTHAARAGAGYGAATLVRSGRFADIRDAATRSVNTTGVTVVASRRCLCVDSAANVVAGDFVCLQACPVGNYRLLTVSVTTSSRFNTIMRLPGIPTDIPLSRTVTMRVTE